MHTQGAEEAAEPRAKVKHWRVKTMGSSSTNRCSTFDSIRAAQLFSFLERNRPVVDGPRRPAGRNGGHGGVIPARELQQLLGWAEGQVFELRVFLRSRDSVLSCCPQAEAETLCRAAARSLKGESVVERLRLFVSSQIVVTLDTGDHRVGELWYLLRLDQREGVSLCVRTPSPASSFAAGSKAEKELVCEIIWAWLARAVSLQSQRQRHLSVPSAPSNKQAVVPSGTGTPAPPTPVGKWLRAYRTRQIATMSLTETLQFEKPAATADATEAPPSTQTRLQLAKRFLKAWE